MKVDQPCEIHWFAFKSHAISNRLGNSLPAQPSTCGVRQRPPTVNGFDVTHGFKLTGFGGMAIDCWARQPMNELADLGLRESNSVAIVFP